MKRFAAFVARELPLMATQPMYAQMGAPGTERAGMPAVAGPLAAKYKTDADRILQAAMADNDGYAALAYLTDHIGKRVSGSSAAQHGCGVGCGVDAQGWTAECYMVQPVMVPHWVRGGMSRRRFSTRGRGGDDHEASAYAGAGHECGDAERSDYGACGVFVHDFAELDALPDAEVKGKRLVVFNPGWHGYGVGVDVPDWRAFTGCGQGCGCGAACGSATGLAMQIPHTGTLRYDEEAARKVPSAAISVEDALLIERLAKEGPVTVHLQMDAHMEQDVKAGNVIGEIVGSEHPEQVVVLGGHIDSWDVGQGSAGRWLGHYGYV